MAIIKCKMCGGDLVLTEGQFVAECEYCGSKQTVPAADNEKKLSLFARANRLRAACEFDKAAGIYETIVAEFPEEAEAYWGLVLCKYGIEYVDDPATGKKIPTCHRSSFDSVMDDGNFEQAMENADQVALRVYRQEAKQIEEIRKGILEVSSSEKPYDIFICYKETDENGDRTVDSLLAQDIYDALTSKGYRVFFSRITLEDKLGQAYEPYIFAALNSAKIMLAVGTCYEYYNAVWVKNEWSRYLKIIAQDKNKYLIPCYKNIDAYDIPKEFAHLQGQDMGKVGAIPDLLRGIEKLLPRQKNDTVIVQEKVVVGNAGGNNKIASLLDRGNMALEDGDWDKADSFFEDVLNNDSKNSQAYLGKALAQHRCRTMDALVRKRKETAMNVPKTTLELQSNTSHIEEMAKKYSLPGYLEEAEIRKLYDFDLKYPSEESGWKKRYGDEVEYWATHRLLFRAEKFADENMLSLLLDYRCAVYDYIEECRKEAAKKESDCREKLEAAYTKHIVECDSRVEKLYNDALSRREQNYGKWLERAKTECVPEILEELASHFDGLRDYKDSADLANHCRKRAAEQLEKFAAEREQQRLIAEQKQKAQKKRMIRKIVISAAAVALTVAAILLYSKVIVPDRIYKEAIALRDSGDYMGAVRTFRKIRYYKDVQEKLEDFKIVYTKELYESGKYTDDTTYEYDENGNMILKVNIDEDGDVDRYTYEYDDNGNLISEKHVGPDWYEYQYTYGYDENGNMLFEKNVYEDGDTSQNTYQYDEKSNMISKVSINRDGDKSEYTYRYDENGNCISEVSIDGDGEIRDYSWTYDENGNMTSKTRKFSGYTWYEEFAYDKNGNLLTHKEENYDGELEIIAEYTYDKNGNVLSVTGKDDYDLYEWKYTYDRMWNVIKKIYTNFGNSKEDAYDNKTTYYSYSYDDDGNLIHEAYGGTTKAYSGYLAFYCPRNAD